LVKIFPFDFHLAFFSPLSLGDERAEMGWRLCGFRFSLLLIDLFSWRENKERGWEWEI